MVFSNHESYFVDDIEHTGTHFVYKKIAFSELNAI